MLKHSIAATVMLVLLSAPAAAFHCPKDVKAIDTAMKSANLSAATKSKVEKLRDEGDALHKTGKHKEAVDKLSEAMRTILTSK